MRRQTRKSNALIIPRSLQIVLAGTPDGEINEDIKSKGFSGPGMAKDIPDLAITDVP